MFSCMYYWTNKLLLSTVEGHRPLFICAGGIRHPVVALGYAETLTPRQIHLPHFYSCYSIYFLLNLLCFLDNLFFVSLRDLGKNSGVFFSSKVLEVSVTLANTCQSSGNSLVGPYENIAADTRANAGSYHVTKAERTFTWGSKLLSGSHNMI